ncbi:hypothetical protein F5X99DRAFT_425230 [Biscogniauxia marginata]|nr:hypothetical protein F5X99DRAFT_425230 [Biscogniauxia marginata]
MASQNQNAAKLTENEVRILGLAWQCFKTDPEIDWKKLADLGGYTNPNSCRNIVRGAKKKITEAFGASSAGPSRPLKRKSGKGTTTEEDDDDGGDAADVPAPAKKAKEDKEATTQSRTSTGKNGHQDRDEQENMANADDDYV